MMEIINYSDVLKESEKVLEKCFKKYSISEIFVSFNGGKDCTVLLDIVLNVLQKRLTNRDDIKMLKLFYIQPENPFPELEKFIHEIEEKYDLTMIVVPGNIREALESILQNYNGLKACLMGTRKTDPHSEHLQFFDMTDANWPQVMRVSPLLNWSYHQIWSYVIEKHVPYCSLYDIGYTSIGNINNTIPNPALKETVDGIITFKPAYLLEDGSLERNGRIKKTPNGKTKLI